MELRHHLVRRTFFRWVHQTWEESPVELNEPNRSKSVEVVARASS
jgi:hypothetical protein